MTVSTTTSIEKAVLTIATGKKNYLDMAINLARSFRLWNKDNNINFFLATDLPNLLPDDVKSYIKIISLMPEEFGKGFSPKLHLDKLAPAGQTLFIDSDCLIYGDLSPAFKKFKSNAVSVIGDYLAKGEWFGDVAIICKKFGVRHLPKFNGGVYYLENGDKATMVYTTARKLENDYDQIGFTRLRGRPNDEVLMALAMELNGCKPIHDDGSIMAEFVNFQSGIRSNLLKGTAELYNNPQHRNYKEDWPLTRARPLIVHFLGHHNQILPYIKEAKQLYYLNKKNKNVIVARALTFVNITLPSKTKSFIKYIFRPAYHLFMGTRQIKKSERIID